MAAERWEDDAGGNPMSDRCTVMVFSSRELLGQAKKVADTWGNTIPLAGDGKYKIHEGNWVTAAIGSKSIRYVEKDREIRTQFRPLCFGFGKAESACLFLVRERRLALG